MEDYVFFLLFGLLLVVVDAAGVAVPGVEAREDFAVVSSALSSSIPRF